MAAEAEAAREARAKVIAAEGEQKAARALREASEVIGDSPAALQLRYLQVNSINCYPISIMLLDNNILITSIFFLTYSRVYRRVQVCQLKVNACHPPVCRYSYIAV